MVDPVADGDELVEAFHLDAQDLERQRSSMGSAAYVCAVLLFKAAFRHMYFKES